VALPLGAEPAPALPPECDPAEAAVGSAIVATSITTGSASFFMVFYPRQECSKLPWGGFRDFRDGEQGELINDSCSNVRIRIRTCICKLKPPLRL
jgi:hypothetical protein